MKNFLNWFHGLFKKKPKPAPTPAPQPVPHPVPTPVPVPVPIPTPIPTPVPVPTPMPVPATDLIWGATITNPWYKIDDIVASIKALPVRMIVRVVIDEGQQPADYKSMVAKLATVADIMIEILDSEYVKDVSVQQYADRTSACLSAFGNKVKYEIGNEITGDWLGNITDVQTKMEKAYDLVTAAGADTVLTVYETNPGGTDKNHEMFAWIAAHVNDKLKAGVKYLLVSYYEDDNQGFQPNWQQVMDKLAAIFPNSRLGIGECGTSKAAEKVSMIQHYYTDVRKSVKTKNWVFGGFWWYFDCVSKNGDGDMVPSTKSLWKTFSDAITK